MITSFAERLWALWAAEKESVEIQKRAFSSVLTGMCPVFVRTWTFHIILFRVVYMRMGRAGPLEGETDKPVHQLVVHGARVAWTQSNRDMWFALYESWRRAQILRKNVSSDALKLVHGEQLQGKKESKARIKPWWGG